MADKMLLIEGNMVDGWEFFGPFDSIEDAEDYADAHYLYDWVITRLVSPEDPE
jgi:hypothetical protein